MGCMATNVTVHTWQQRQNYVLSLQSMEPFLMTWVVAFSAIWLYYIRIQCGNRSMGGRVIFHCFHGNLVCWFYLVNFNEKLSHNGYKKIPKNITTGCKTDISCFLNLLEIFRKVESGRKFFIYLCPSSFRTAVIQVSCYILSLKLPWSDYISKETEVIQWDCNTYIFIPNRADYGECPVVRMQLLHVLCPWNLFKEWKRFTVFSE